MIDLYTAASGNGRRATIMLEECGLEYRLHRIEIGPGAKKAPEFLAVNPQGTIPMIVDRKEGVRPVVLLQSGAILLYLARKTGRFLPTDLDGQATTYQWMMFALTDIVGANTAMYLSGTKLGIAAAETFFEQELVGFLRICDSRLALSPYLATSEPTIADLALFPVAVSRRALIERTDALDHLRQWAAIMRARPAIERALAALP